MDGKLCKAKQLQGMIYKTQFLLHNIIIHLVLIALTCSLVCSFIYPYWFPSFLCSSIKQFLFLCLPVSSTYSSILSPKCLFVVVNVIVVFLVGESMLVRSNHSSPADEIYDEYVERNRSLRGVISSSTTIQGKVEHKSKSVLDLAEKKRVDPYVQEEIKEVIESSIVIGDQETNKEEVQEDQTQLEEVQEDQTQLEEEAQEDQTQVEEEAEGKVEDNYEEVNKRDGEEENGMATEELNRRVEEFIARVNKQRWLEEVRLLVCCRA